jgi:hypothetical protein
MNVKSKETCTAHKSVGKLELKGLRPDSQLKVRPMTYCYVCHTILSTENLPTPQDPAA